ncbi:MAG TPA: c-type cytochrome [Thermoleophilaceae bacterium]|nr:c-type cytochrome [Thermoleophilaceae bacterium]
MFRRTARLLAAGAAFAIVAAACGEEIELAQDDPLRRGAELFNERCSGCHTLDAAAATAGSKPEGELEGGERTNGPNFNQRVVDKDAALFAIRNGGFSGAIMPANIVVGEDAELVAEFLAEYSGGEASSEETASGARPGSAGGAGGG